ncbi:MAG: DUF4124 domain-containing protein [Methylococcaceae bacterium]|nr:DUF4124 domain-containing protein [Methylococcaceae bacterium]
MRFALLILGCFFSAHATAGIYKCTDSEGNTKYLSKPCAVGDKNIQINLKTGATTDLNKKQSEEELKQKEEQAKTEQQKLEEQAQQQRQEKLLNDANQESAKNQFVIKNNPDKYSAYAIPPYVPDNLSALVKTYQDRLSDIERMRRQAAEKALNSGQCARVESSELNIKSKKNTLVFLVDCSSGKHFYFTELELTTS